MKTPSFTEQYNKIVGAYMKNTLQPFDPCACFIGNLLNGNDNWEDIRRYILRGNSSMRHADDLGILGEKLYENGEKCIISESNGLYSLQEILNLENNFLKIVKKIHPFTSDAAVVEDSLFEAMESTLLMLKEIHKSKGEIVENYIFTKRELQTA